MSKQVEPSVVTLDRPQRLSLRERGMVTIEYAIGAVLVIVLVGVIIAAIQQGWFGDLVHSLVALLMQAIPRALGA
ncbi:hypothetical protein [Propioniciclava tarda]|uniref:DUF4244 domain-containing protein n=1 Tax=Propioniciclava tarda TaxID=433330 RepID=A0A4V2JSW2_PROTD|nr:hypothetical protein [Propioniciclava tarda]TBT92131.1 hypothetical protein ET996_13505 [Propioniciclava tarda]SMO84085.1 hypothetical protein SAMN06266982_12419 [Propioniciclava tarda]HOA88640.1 hypothetical protein [Propioniciclava tarda]HQA30948.1 hypothetical protein [Propioniciclava tarda]HQD60411.1 hypothetical protein [Propioniciclava tarda]